MKLSLVSEITSLLLLATTVATAAANVRPSSQTLSLQDLRTKTHRDPLVINHSNHNHLHHDALTFRGGAKKVAPPPPKKSFLDGIPTKGLYGVIVMAMIETSLKKVFAAANINFPSMLGGCIFLFAFAVLAQLIHPGWGDAIHDFLEPGAALLSKWLPSFFVPGLAMLPLAPSIGGGSDIVKAFSTVLLGLIYSMSTIAFTVLTLRKAQGASNAEPTAPPAPKKNKGKQVQAAATPKPKPFSDATLTGLTLGCALSLVACIAATRMDLADLATPLQTTALILATLGGFVWAARMPVSITKVVHPLVTSSIITVAAVQLIALGIGSDLKEVLKSYKVGSLNPLKMGAGDVLLWVLGPSVVSFAVSMYSRKQLMYDNFLVIVTAVLVSSIGGLFGTAAFVRAIKLGGSTGSLPRLSMLPRNVTTALAMVISSIIGGDISLTAVAVVVTGVLAATYGKNVLKSLGVNDPITRGLAMGGAGQGLGVSAMSDEADAFPFAAIAMVLTAVTSTTLVSIPVIKSLLVDIATGTASA